MKETTQVCVHVVVSHGNQTKQPPGQIRLLMFQNFWGRGDGGMFCVEKMMGICPPSKIMREFWSTHTKKLNRERGICPILISYALISICCSYYERLFLSGHVGVYYRVSDDIIWQREFWWIIFIYWYLWIICQLILCLGYYLKSLYIKNSNLNTVIEKAEAYILFPVNDTCTHITILFE